MSTKAEMIAKINTDLADSSTITASEHRSVLHTDSDSVLENIYRTPIQEDSTGTPTITTSNANFDYSANFTKVGNQITVAGTITVNNSQSANSTVLTISDSEFDASSDLFDNTGTGKSAFDFSDTVLIRMVGTELKIVDAVLAGEIFIFKVTYTAVN